MNKSICLIVSLLLASLLLSCQSYTRNRARSINHHIMEIDTITIHGHRHEILIRSEGSNQIGYGGIMHSPECPCKKKGGQK
ncbi:MAG: hypothetical protein HDS95_00130 [Bacteroidales bacterium]|nr:hypothetical protein [Bacteroidales bacterium]